MAWMFIPQIDPEAIWNRIWSGIWTLKCEKWQKKRGNCHGTSHRNWDWRSGKFDDHQKGAGGNNYHYLNIYIYIIHKSSQESIHQSTSQNIISIIGETLMLNYFRYFFNQSTFYEPIVDGCEIPHHQKDGWNPINNGIFTIYQLVIRISLCHPPYVTLW